MLCVAMILSPIPAGAEENQPLVEHDLEFLEFLGEWETDTGLWVNPFPIHP